MTRTETYQRREGPSRRSKLLNGIAAAAGITGACGGLGLILGLGLDRDARITQEQLKQTPPGPAAIEAARDKASEREQEEREELLQITSPEEEVEHQQPATQTIVIKEGQTVLGILRDLGYTTAEEQATALNLFGFLNPGVDPNAVRAGESYGFPAEKPAE